MTTTLDAASRQIVVDDAEGVADRRHHRPWMLSVCIVVVSILYATSAFLAPHDSTTSDFHRRQAAAIADGHLDIRPVPEALRALPDPYDASANLSVRVDGGVQDLAYRDGRLYSAHGLTTPLLLAPSEILFGTAAPNWVITLVACWVGFLAGAWILVQVRRRFIPQLPDMALSSAVLAFGLCGPVWVLMSMGNGYEAAIAVAFALTMAGSALLLRATEPWPRLRRWHAIGGSTCLALAIGARPTAAVAAIAIVVLIIAMLRSARSNATAANRIARVAADLAVLVIPYAVVIAAVGWTNAIRFGSPTEFGFGFQLSIWNMRTYPMGRPTYLAPNLADYLTAAPQLSTRFPWIRPRGLIGGDRPGAHTAEPIVGLLFLAPVLVVGLGSLASGLRRMRQEAAELATATLTAIAIGTTALIAISLPFNTSTLRYAADAAPMLLLAAGVGWAWARCNSTDASQRRSLDRAWIVALVVGIAMTASVQMPG